MLHSTKQKKYNQTAELTGTRNKQEESFLVNKYLYLVHAVIKKMGYINCISDNDDMKQVGLIALLKMIRRFPVMDDEKEFIRLTYIRIRGSILDEIRSRDWRSEESRKNASTFLAQEKALMQSLGRLPNKSEMLENKVLSEQQYEEARCAINGKVFSELSDQLLKDNAQSVDICTEIDNTQCLSVALKQLTEEEVLILHLMYEKDMSFKEMALATNNNFSRINKIQREAHRKLTYLVVNKGGLL
ncbi:RNA polymerase, sigma 28 subunit, SigD/FliA/WhiG [Psychromonas ingrahamii 37]|uniref:RNA polymerase, sigma 28 subunit, SigD/FliA/WhiG n=1 Tax=Psychromonas ingrahamii (strain DSM 17664 / CCUG 51855 / 37) TaxID=357804 RepID=A1T0J9_PSYIN|nr:sigma-70 family RNA polymerase sigma factor [Psychromonas ingrahamii]ABM05264.1 RNA polymerase, sigma 28 subunit, SigD/FliA/WhiG [Psychromonas ingrahamii 37]